jgi:hypothetical protein
MIGFIHRMQPVSYLPAAFRADPGCVSGQIVSALAADAAGSLVVGFYDQRIPDCPSGEPCFTIRAGDFPFHGEGALEHKNKRQHGRVDEISQPEPKVKISAAAVGTWARKIRQSAVLNP